MISNRTYGIDADVIAYNARIIAGGNQSLSMQSLRQLNQFVISIKKMGLWYNIVCWPLRANQNAGSGTRVYSLGGLGVYDGTMNGTISWQPNGIFYPNDNTHKWISTAFTMAFDSANSSFAVGALTPTASTVRRYIGAPSVPASPLTVGVSANTTTMLNIDVWSESVGTNLAFSRNLSIFNWLGISWNYASSSNNINGQVNSTFETSSRASSATGKRGWTIGGGQFVTDNFTGTMSIAIYFPIIDVSQADKLLLYNLYKSTLGQDLGLP
jgi:hypothetical protein